MDCTCEERVCVSYTVSLYCYGYKKHAQQSLITRFSGRRSSVLDHKLRDSPAKICIPAPDRCKVGQRERRLSGYRDLSNVSAECDTPGVNPGSTDGQSSLRVLLESLFLVFKWFSRVRSATLLRLLRDHPPASPHHPLSAAQAESTALCGLLFPQHPCATHREVLLDLPSQAGRACRWPRLHPPPVLALRGSPGVS